MSDYRESILISKAKYEALMAAKEALYQLTDACPGCEDWNAAADALDACRAAGIETGEGK